MSFSAIVEELMLSDLSYRILQLFFSFLEFR